VVQKKEKDLRSKKKILANCLSLLHFLHSKKRNRQFSTSLYQDTSKFESPEIGPTFNDPTIVPNLTTAVNTSEFKTSNLSNCDLTNTHIVENISHDPGTYCDDILTEEKRNIWILKGPEFFQNTNSNFCETFASFSDISGKTKTTSLT